ncbi:MAG: hypothetical protein EOM67_10290 [Spirochaetia bacterium]|nr:hypothetical protein [Spirochaetia bacterium]
MSKIHTYVLILALLLLPTMIFASGDKEDNSTVSTKQEGISVGENWAFDYEFKDNKIEFTVTAPTTGWVGIGFNPSSRMKDADYVLGYVKEGSLYLQDSYGTSNTSHASDESLGGTDNVVAISGTEMDGKTTIVFALPLDSKDIYDKKFVQGDTYKVLLAYGKDNSDDFTSMHTKRQSMNVVLK